jgi:uncharacterized BrkB/YihY/UPF0761 family membrane protein
MGGPLKRRKPMFNWCRRWLMGVGVLFAVFGLLLATCNQSPLFNALFNQRIDAVFWKVTPPPAEYRLFQIWIYGVLGATCAGWGTMIAWLAYWAFPLRKRWVWHAVFVAVWVWFIPDTIISLSSGVYYNVFINVALLLAVLAPLALSRREFFGSRG